MPYSPRDEDYEEPLAAPSAMWTDLYELTMAQTLYLEGMHNRRAVFHAFVRSMPNKGAFLVTAGQNIIFEWLDKNWRFTPRDLRRLAAKTAKDSKTGADVPIFRPDFLEMIGAAKMELTIEAMPEGELAFPMEPIVKVSGPLWQCLCVEAAILNTINSQSNFATYAALLKTLAKGKPVVEFGLRRAQAVGGLSSTRGAYIGGVDASSNCWAETNYSIATIGTMAHAYVMVHENEMDAFAAWARHNPHQGVFLVDTYSTLEGVRKVIEVCAAQNVALSGIRLDSGDLAYLAVQSRKILDEAGFQAAKIIVSNGLDATTIEALEHQGAPIDLYAVGTSLATASDQPALGGVYKVSALYDASGKNPQSLVKLSEDAIKISYPGELDVVRYITEKNGKLFFDGGTILTASEEDILSKESAKFGRTLLRDIESVNRRNEKIARVFKAGTRAYRPLQTYFDAGVLTGTIETVHEARARAMVRMDMLDASHRRRLNPHEYVVGIEKSLLERQSRMVRALLETGDVAQANRAAGGV